MLQCARSGPHPRRPPWHRTAALLRMQPGTGLNLQLGNYPELIRHGIWPLTDLRP